jgi:hypothetical protein
MSLSRAICNTAAVRAIGREETSMKLMQTVGNYLYDLAHKIFVNSNKEAAWQ